MILKFILQLLPVLPLCLAVLMPVSENRPDNDGINLNKIPSPAFNPITPEGVELGKTLFFDKLLSADSSLSCAGCHKPQFAFSDSAQYSPGINGNHTGRNALSLCNLAWQPFYMWDGRVAQLEEVIMLPITNPDEMGSDTVTLLQKLNKHRLYPAMFERAFHTKPIYFEQVAHAISQYLRTLVSANTQMERQIAALKNENTPDNVELVKKIMPFASEKVVKLTFTCLACHTHDRMFGGLVFKNNGLDAFTNNEGYIVASHNPNDEGMFKAPTLKNIELTAPYMHDGRFKTLEEVVEHYNSGIKPHPNLGKELKDSNGNPLRLNLSNKEKKQLVRFLEMFTDTAFLQLHHL